MRDKTAAIIVIGNEISCRIGSVAPGQLHRRGFHPTGLFATFGAAFHPLILGHQLDAFVHPRNVHDFGFFFYLNNFLTPVLGE